MCRLDFAPLKGGAGITGSPLVPIVVPIVVSITLAAWLGIVYWADAIFEGKGPVAWIREIVDRICAVQPQKEPNEENQAVCNRVLCRACCWSRKISFATWLNLDVNQKRTHWYVLGWLGFLIFSLFIIPRSGWVGWLLVGLAFYRLQDLLFSTLDNVFHLTKKSVRSSDWSLTLVVLALVNIVQIVLIFAIAYRFLTGHNPKSFENPPSGSFDAFYLSWTSLPPLGGGASPHSIMAKALAMAEEATGLLIIVIAIGRFLGVADPKRSEAAATSAGSAKGPTRGVSAAGPPPGPPPPPASSASTKSAARSAPPAS